MFFKRATPSEPKVQCRICSGSMRVIAKIPEASSLPEMVRYRCDDCGSVRSFDAPALIAAAA
jgi:hypothetical protein